MCANLHFTIIAFTFHKSERLCSRKKIDLLFGKGASSYSAPVKLMYMKDDPALDVPAQAMFVVPKRNVKHAVNRNTLKRRMRESYRLFKPELYEALRERKVILAFIYTSSKEEAFEKIDQAVKKSIKKMLAELV